jgi:hypothetical protein
MTFDGTCERGGFQRAPQETEKIPPVPSHGPRATASNRPAAGRTRLLWQLRLLHLRGLPTSISFVSLGASVVGVVPGAAGESGARWICPHATCHMRRGS